MKNTLSSTLSNPAIGTTGLVILTRWRFARCLQEGWQKNRNTFNEYRTLTKRKYRNVLFVCFISVLNNYHFI